MMNNIYFYSLYVFGLVLFVVGLFLPPTPSACFVVPAICIVSILTYVLFLVKVASKLKHFKFTLSVFVLVAIYHLAWLLVGLLETQLHWSNGPESILFFYYMSVSLLRILPQISLHEGVNMILYSIAIPVSIALCVDGVVLLFKKLNSKKAD
jgi:hypothetical protein